MYRASCCRPISVLMMGGRFCLILPLMVPSSSCTWRDCACGIIRAHGLLCYFIESPPHFSPARLLENWFPHSELDNFLLSVCHLSRCPHSHTRFQSNICPQCKVSHSISKSVTLCHHQSHFVGSIDFTFTISSWLPKLWAMWGGESSLRNFIRCATIKGIISSPVPSAWYEVIESKLPCTILVPQVRMTMGLASARSDT